LNTQGQYQSALSKLGGVAPITNISDNCVLPWDDHSICCLSSRSCSSRCLLRRSASGFRDLVQVRNRHGPAKIYKAFEKAT
jgi:hypothetical protein